MLYSAALGIDAPESVELPIYQEVTDTKGLLTEVATSGSKARDLPAN